jgi:coenzyme F420-reducing hydrogenase gamma subunit
VAYARPDYIDTLRTSTAIADHVPVDFELRGCPIDRRQLLEVIGALAPLKISMAALPRARPSCV